MNGQHGFQPELVGNAQSSAPVPPASRLQPRSRRSDRVASSIVAQARATPRSDPMSESILIELQLRTPDASPNGIAPPDSSQDNAARHVQEPAPRSYCSPTVLADLLSESRSLSRLPIHRERLACR